jgi:hypothetical protein
MVTRPVMTPEAKGLRVCTVQSGTGIDDVWGLLLQVLLQVSAPMNYTSLLAASGQETT